MTTISRAITRLDSDRECTSGKRYCGSVNKMRDHFEQTKQPGKLVMLEGEGDNSGLLINFNNRHIAVPLSKRELAGLAIFCIQQLEAAE